MFLRPFVLLFLFMAMSACSSDRGPAPDNTAARAPGTAPSGSGDAAAPSAGQAQSERKQALLATLDKIRRSNLDGSRTDEVKTLITELTSLTRVLGVTARALDRSGAFEAEISAELAKFNDAEKARSDDAGRILNGMSGVYGMYALLAKMRFAGQEERQAEIQEIHDATVTTLTTNAPVVEAAAAIAEACYSLSSMIIRDIDSEGRYDKAFTQIELQYQQGKRVANKQEDVFINGMFRAYEVSQLWLLSINPKATDVITDLNAGVSEDSGNATNVGMQMGVAAKYLFLISYLIAQDTVNLML